MDELEFGVLLESVESFRIIVFMHQKFNPFAMKQLHEDVDDLLSHISLRKLNLYGKVLKNLMLYGTDTESCRMLSVSQYDSHGRHCCR